MFNHLERELKILVSESVWQKISEEYSFEEEVVQENIYFDDDADTLKGRGALRMRHLNGNWIFTLKIRLDDITQIELEKKTDTNNPNEITDAEILGWLKQYHLGPLHVIAHSKTWRKIAQLPHAELCVDKTDFGTFTDYEIEYEYKKDHDGIGAFNEILAPFHLVYTKNAPSKLARALKFMHQSVEEGF